MRAFAEAVRLFAENESGATAIEYGLIVSLIFLAILSSVGTMSAVVTALYTLVAAMTG